MSVKAIPDGFHTITPQLNIEGAADAIEFYKKAFGAEEIHRAMDHAGKKVMHAELQIGTSKIFVNDTFPEMGGGATASRANLWLYVNDVDASYAKAAAAGAKGKAPEDMFWGDRMAHLADPFGQQWTLAQHVKDMSPAEMKAAEEAFMASMKK